MRACIRPDPRRPRLTPGDGAAAQATSDTQFIMKVAHRFTFLFAAFFFTFHAVAEDAPSSGKKATCAFANAEVMTSLAICRMAAEFYIKNKEWPLSKAQLHEQALILKLPEKDADAFFARFSLLELKRQDENCVLQIQFEADGKKVHQRMLLKPGPSADEIVQSTTGEALPF